MMMSGSRLKDFPLRPDISISQDESSSAEVLVQQSGVLRPDKRHGKYKKVSMVSSSSSFSNIRLQVMMIDSHTLRSYRLLI